VVHAARSDAPPAPPQTEVWSVRAQHTETPRRVVVLPGKANHAVLCDAAISEGDAVRPTGLVYMVGSAKIAPAPENAGPFLTAARQRLHIVDIATAAFSVADPFDVRFTQRKNSATPVQGAAEFVVSR
jgi:hypothetical protein